jgi:transcriptional regulator with XRE-family HTH domain
MILGKKLMDLRISKNLTREKIAQEIGVSKTAYGKWESDISKPNFDNINTICNFYGITKDELMSEEKTVSQNNNTFNNSPNVINSPNPTFTYSMPNEVIEKILDNQLLISNLVKNQDLLLKNLLEK